LQAAQRQQCQEAILVNERREWLETATGNLWGWYQEQWWTPPEVSGGITPVNKRWRNAGLYALLVVVVIALATAIFDGSGH
jgi:hypothetical protein